MKVNEIFESWQGEIPAGVPALFIRLQGCNRDCHFCDTKYAQDPSSGVEMKLEDLIDICNNSDMQQIVITGGEPLLQWNEVRKLISKVNKKFIIETNGDIEPPDKPWYVNITWIVSPKSIEIADKWFQSPVILKIPIELEKQQCEIEWFEWLVGKQELLKLSQVWLMLVTRDGETIEEIMKKYKYLVTKLTLLSLQVGIAPRLQKFFGIK